jgi:hypothetical protein
MTTGFAVIVPIGPGKAELRRFSELLDSLWTYDPHARLCVAVDSSPESRDLPLESLSRGCRFITLHAPYHGQGKPLFGRLSAGILLALRTVFREGPFDFVLRMDTDALIVGPFREAVLGFIAQHPEAGIVGTLGSTCRRDVYYYGCEKASVSDVFRALECSPAPERVVEHAHLAVENGYVGKEYCQGGVYVLPFETLRRMSSMGIFDSPEDWLALAVPEDVMMGMYARTVGLRSLDFSLPGEPFGNHHRGLAYSPREMVRLGYSLIHSTKGDVDYSESQIRGYFRARRARVVSAAGYSRAALFDGRPERPANPSDVR